MATKALATFVQGFHDPAVIENMVYRQFGKTQRQVSAFSYGASALGGVFSSAAVDEEESVAVVRETIKLGVNLIDVAPWYGFGKAETVLGRALKGIPRQAYYLHTKVGRYEADIVKRFDFSYERTLKSIDESLERLGVAYIDTIQSTLCRSPSAVVLQSSSCKSLQFMTQNFHLLRS
jgi:L-galactose dehydrogenase